MQPSKSLKLVMLQNFTSCMIMISNALLQWVFGLKQDPYFSRILHMQSRLLWKKNCAFVLGLLICHKKKKKKIKKRKFIDISNQVILIAMSTKYKQGQLTVFMLPHNIYICNKMIEEADDGCCIVIIALLKTNAYGLTQEINTSLSMIVYRLMEKSRFVKLLIFVQDYILICCKI